MISCFDIIIVLKTLSLFHLGFTYLSFFQLTQEKSSEWNNSYCSRVIMSSFAT